MSTNLKQMYDEKVRCEKALTASHIHAEKMEEQRDELREALADLRNAQQELAAHPANDSTNRYDDLLMRLEIAEERADTTLANLNKTDGE